MLFINSHIKNNLYMKCPKCKMKIPNGAEICPYCRSRVQGFGFMGDLYDDFKEGYKKGKINTSNWNANTSNSGCMVILPLIVVVASSICYFICSFII